MEVKKWMYRTYDETVAADLARQYKIPTAIAALFVQRGLTEDGAIRRFLNPDLRRLQNPLSLPDMEKAVARIVRALETGEAITVYGDYDVDGITSVFILTHYLRARGAQVDYYIPDRMAEGYGMHIGALESILASGANLLVTVDSGITALDEVAFATDRGMDVIITDHHECPQQLPAACAVVNPKRRNEEECFNGFCGAGVAFLLVLALEQYLTGKSLLHFSGEIPPETERLFQDYGVFAAIGTVADVMPLRDDNRILVAEGLRRIAQTKNTGLRALLSASGLLEKEITSSKIAFALAPRINAAGRLGRAQRAVELFLSPDPAFCEQTAQELCNENNQRRTTESEILDEAEDFIENYIDLNEEKVLVISGNNWHHGVLGIVCSKITDRYHRPSILISFDDDGIGKGSGRSIHELNLFDALRHSAGRLLRFGGHDMAAGLSIARDQLDAFRKEINAYAASYITSADFVAKMEIDCPITAREVSLPTYKKICRFEPFGSENPEPVFSLSGAKIISMRKVGMDKHLKLVLRLGGKDLDAIGFGLAPYADFLKVGDVVSVAFSLSVNDYYQTPKEQLIIKDIHL